MCSLESEDLQGYPNQIQDHEVIQAVTNLHPLGYLEVT